MRKNLNAVLFFPIAFLVLLKVISGLQAAGAAEGAGSPEPKNGSISSVILPKLKGELPLVMGSAQKDAIIPISIVLREQVSRSEILVLGQGKSKAERLKAISVRLKEVASRSQLPILSILEREKQGGHARRIRPLWLSNVIGVDTTRAIIEEIAGRPDVKYINYNPKRDVFLHTRASSNSSAALQSQGIPAAAPAAEPLEIECGVELMRAPDVWDLLGITGDGAVVAVIDTGVCLNHPDIVNQIWVNPGEDLDHDGVIMDPDDENGVDDDSNGFIDDFVGWNFDLGNNNPDDQNSHGSHVAGTVAGDGTSGTKAGMAHGAKIMVVRVGVTFADEVDVWNAMQYAADNNADLISMSLGWPHNQNPDRATWRANCENTIEMGTAMVIAAGNEGSGNEPDNVRTPGDVPRVITVGATDCNDEIAGFSSRGPVTWQDVDPYNDYPYPPGLIKPDVSAPGVDTKSHNFCSGYSLKSGTSMATPHTAGAAALMVSADPTLFPDDIKEVLEQTAVDLGVPGKDNEYGSGRVDAYEAVNQVAGKITYHSHTIDDSNPNYGNGDGNVDFGETVTIRVTLRNKETTPATNVWAVLTTKNTGVIIRDKVAYYPDIAGEATAESKPPHFTITVNEGCGALIKFKMEIHHDSGAISHTGFSVRVGEETETTFFQDDMETDKGWAVSGTATAGIWVREDPYEVKDSEGRLVQPEDDTTASPGVKCWVTGNPRPSGKFQPGDGDVDGGAAVLESPIFDATGAGIMTLDLNRWFYHVKSDEYDSSFFELAVSNNGGSSYSILERVEGMSNQWLSKSLNVSSILQPSSQMRIRVRVVEESGWGIPIGDIIVEGLIDDVRFYGTHYECDVFTAPPANPPNKVGDTLQVTKEENNVRLEWQAPPTDATHDAATLYRIYRSDKPDTGFAELGSATATFYLDLKELDDLDSHYYKVVAENGGGTETD
ncbi:MAG: S8 family serine peptidase [Acidobacteriota bacterium]